MTFETDGGGHRGVLWRRADGTLLSLRDGIAKHFVASLATIEATSSRAPERVRDYLAFRRRAVADGRSGAIRRVIIAPARDPGRAAELVSALLRAGIEVRRASAAFSAARAHAYADDAVATRRFDAGAFVVDLAQPQGKVAKAILEPTHELDPAFAQAQIAKFQRNHRRGRRAEAEEYEFYDVTAWSLPVAFGVDAYWTDDTSPVAGELLTLPAEEPALPQAQQQPRRIGGELLAVDVGGGIVAGRGATSAYLFSPERNGAPKLAYQLLADGFRVAVASQPIDAGGRQWPRGTYVVRVARNDSTLATRLDALARASAVEVTGVNSAQAGAGQYGIGSESIIAIPAPSIAVIADEGVSQTGYGAIWFSLERRYGVRFTPIGISELDRDLSKFTAIVFPSGRYSRVSKDAVERLKTWVRGGGTLVTMGSATAWAAEEGVALTSARRIAAEPESSASKPEPAPAKPATPAAAAAPARSDLTRGERPDRAGADPVSEHLGEQRRAGGGPRHQRRRAARPHALAHRRLRHVAAHGARRGRPVSPAVEGRGERGDLPDHGSARARRLHLARQHRAPAARHQLPRRRADRLRTRGALHERAALPRLVARAGQAGAECAGAGGGVLSSTAGAGVRVVEGGPRTTSGSNGFPRSLPSTRSPPHSRTT